MNLETIRDYARHLHRRGVEVVELEENGVGVKIRISVGGTNLPGIAVPESGGTKAATPRPGIVKSQTLGWFRTIDAEHLSSPVSNGDVVLKDQVLAVIELGAARTFVRSPHAGQVVQVCAQEGDSIDYGKLLFEVAPPQGAGMTQSPDFVKSLIDVVAEEGIAELEIREGSQTIRILQRASAAFSAAEALQATPQAQVVTTTRSETAAAPVAGAKAEPHKVTAPMSGTFYRSTSPGGEPLAKVGAPVQTGQVLCVIEAMKILNEVASTGIGLVDEVFFQDGESVEQGQVLFSIRGGSDVQ